MAAGRSRCLAAEAVYRARPLLHERMDRDDRLNRKALVRADFSWSLAIVLAVSMGLPLAGYLLLFFG